MVTNKLSGSFGGTAQEPMSTESTGDTALRSPIDGLDLSETG